MALLEIKKYPDPILKKTCSKIDRFDQALHTLLDNMRETMYAANGIGLAAPQVGSLQQIAVIDVSPEGQDPIELINPFIRQKSGVVPSEEGCLSIPGYRDTIERSESVVLAAFDRHGEPFEIEASGLLAICIQHELDHLHGTLFVDRLSRLKREFFRRWWRKEKTKQDQESE